MKSRELDYRLLREPIQRLESSIEHPVRPFPSQNMIMFVEYELHE